MFREPIPEFGYLRYDTVKVIDKARIAVLYDVKLIADTLNTVMGKDKVKTLIGSRYAHSFGYYLWCQSKDWSREDNPPKEQLHDDRQNSYDPKGYNALINWFVYRNLDSKTIKNIHALPLRPSRYAIGYDEPQPRFSWTINSETIELLGYQCQKAQTDYAGRRWSVWFTPEIPIDCGFWKFSGLPGLILRAEDSNGFYLFNAISIENSDEDIEISKSIKIKNLSKEAFRKLEQQTYADPISNGVFARQGHLGGRHLGPWSTSEEFHTIYFPENYLNLYFPMELE